MTSLMGKRQQHRRERHRAVLAAAMAIVVEEGLAALTMPALAARLGVAVGGLYRYFPSKEALLVALQGEALGAFAAEVAAEGAAIDTGDLEPQAAALHRIARLAWAYLDDAVRAPARHRLIDALISAPDPLLGAEAAEAAEAPLRELLTSCAALLSAACERGALATGDPHARTHVLWAAVHGLDHLRKRDPRLPPALRSEALARGALEALLRGWGAPERALAVALAALPPLRER